MNLPELRAINSAKIKTLMKSNPHSPALMRAQVVAQILADDDCFAKMTTAEAVSVLTALGFTPAGARAVLAAQA